MTYLLPTKRRIFDVKKQLQFERAQKLWKEVKNDTAKYEKTITELKQKGQIRKSKQISYWPTLRPNILSKTARETSSEDLEDIFSNTKTVTYDIQPLNEDEN